MGEVLEDGKISCRLCGERTHVMKIHLRDTHPEVLETDYQEQFPHAPMLSPMAIERLKTAATKAEPATPAVTCVAGDTAPPAQSSAHLHELFGLGDAPAAKNSKGQPLLVTTFASNPETNYLIPDVDDNYVFQIAMLKTMLMGLETGTPTYLWGMSGTGKTTIFEQIMARTKRPWIRIQHTMNMEERDLTGQWTVKGGETHFNLGPLPMAMKYGLTYCADEYDVALPAVLMVYQPVLEGKPLIIKDADPENRIIRPHPNFRFIATGNTNGMGDETGLYQGTLIQNAANYERFGITEEMLYPPEAVEIPLVQGQARVPVAIAQKLVKIAAMCREAYRAGKLSLPPSPRALIRAGQNGKRLGDWARGLQLAYTNRLTRVDQQAVNEIVQRVGLTS